jgi:5-methylcytosine-specific restriction endonuclease McrA
MGMVWPVIKDKFPCGLCYQEFDSEDDLSGHLTHIHGLGKRRERDDMRYRILIWRVPACPYCRSTTTACCGKGS